MELSATLRNITASGVFELIGVGLNVAHSVAGNTPSDNAVLANWRDTIVHFYVVHQWNWTIPWADNVAVETEITESVVPMLEAVSPGSGAYMNEADPHQPDFQQVFYGSNYAKLRALKKKYDPNDLFYATTAVGSEAWAVQSNGGLCRTGK